MRRRLIIVSLAVTSMVTLAFLIPLASLVRELARDRVLSGAERDAQLIAQFVTTRGQSDGDTLSALGFGSSLNGNDLTVIEIDGTISGADLQQGENLGQAFSGSAFRSELDGGEAVYVPSIRADGSTAVVRVFVDDTDLSSNVLRSWVVLGGLGLVLILIGLLAADRLGRSMVEPVRRLSVAANRLGGGDLETRVSPSGPPELVEVGAEFNHLAERIGRLLQAEREQAADLSHRLRTPLTAARLDAEALSQGPDRERVLADLDELERTIDYIIEEARRPIRADEAGPVDFSALLASRVEFWQALADEQGRSTSIDINTTPTLVVAPAADLEAMVDVLLDNIFAHTPEGTGYGVALSAENGVAFLQVSDEGPGIDPPAADRRGASGSGSTGLGLDIARRTAELAGGSLALRRGPEEGTLVAIELPVQEAGG